MTHSVGQTCGLTSMDADNLQRPNAHFSMSTYLHLPIRLRRFLWSLKPGHHPRIAQ
jgi:hypothetical protein